MAPVTGSARRREPAHVHRLCAVWSTQGSVYVAATGYMLAMAGIQRNCVIVAVNNIKTPTIEGTGIHH